MNTGVIYLRVSTKEQRAEGYSLQDQRERCLTLAGEAGLSVPGEYIFEEDWSGAELDRPQFNKVRDLIERKCVSALIALDVDRLSRKLSHKAIIEDECEKYSVELLYVIDTPRNTPEQRMFSDMKGVFAEYERAKIADRTVRGRRAKAESGKIPSGSHARLYGYTYNAKKYGGDGTRQLHDDQAVWVCRMFDWLIDEGLSTNAITFRLRAEGVPTPSGKGYWIRSTVRKILTNSAYCGKTYAFTQTYGEPRYRMKPDTKRKKTGLIKIPESEWLEIKGATPPIITESQFEAAQEQLRRNSELSARNMKYQYLLRGHIYCKDCGKSYWGFLHRKKRGDKIYETRRYRCSGRLRIVTPVQCSNKTYNAERLEELVWNQVELLLSNPELIVSELARRKEQANEIAVFEPEFEVVEWRLKELDRQQQKLLGLALRDFPEDQIQTECQKINSERANLKERRLQLLNKIEMAKQAEVDLVGIEMFCELVKMNLGKFSYEDKRLALDALQVKVWIDGDQIEMAGVIPMPVEGDIVTMQSGWHIRSATPLLPFSLALASK